MLHEYFEMYSLYHNIQYMADNFSRCNYIA